MNMGSPRTPQLRTGRLSLDPLRREDARSMVAVLADPALYAFTGGQPPTAAELDATYGRWLDGPAGAHETWHNWIVRLAGEDAPIGHVQATVSAGGRTAEVAWLIGTPWQGQGYGAEAARGLTAWLRSEGVVALTAFVHPDHSASGRVAASAGLAPSADVVDGEIAWRWTAPSPVGENGRQ